MKLPLLLVFSFTIRSIFAQETELKIKVSSSYIEEFDVLKSDKKIRHGSYLKYSYGLLYKIFIHETGQYYYNKKDSIWKKLVSNQLEEEFSYEKGILEGKYNKYFIDTSNVEVKLKLVNNPGKKNDYAIADLNKENGKKIISGYFHENKKSGVWTYYDLKGKIFFQFNYDDSLIIVDRSDSIYNVKITDPLFNSKPIYLGGSKDGLGIELIPAIFQYFKGDSISITFKFQIRQDGNLDQIEILESSYSKGKEKKIIGSTKISQNWIPGKLSSKFIDDYLIFRYNIKKESDRSYSVNYE
jgi:hypothetical protein